MQAGASAGVQEEPWRAGEAPGLILLVDDEPLLVLTLADILEDDGYRVLTAANGAAALELVRRYHPALVFLDLRMPGMGGEEVARRILAQPGAPAIVVLTAVATEEQRASLLRMGVAAVLTKPVPIPELLAIVRGVCRPAPTGALLAHPPPSVCGPTATTSGRRS